MSVSGTTADQQEQIGRQKGVVLKMGYLRQTSVVNHHSTLKIIWHLNSILVRQWIILLSAFHKNGKVNEIVTKAFLKSYFKGMKNNYEIPSSVSTFSLQENFLKMKRVTSLWPTDRKD